VTICRHHQAQCYFGYRCQQQTEIGTFLAARIGERTDWAGHFRDCDHVRFVAKQPCLICGQATIGRPLRRPVLPQMGLANALCPQCDKGQGMAEKPKDRR
jgi:hypothetical protein